jgi:hypothetical protein
VVQQDAVHRCRGQAGNGDCGHRRSLTASSGGACVSAHTVVAAPVLLRTRASVARIGEKLESRPCGRRAGLQSPAKQQLYCFSKNLSLA